VSVFLADLDTDTMMTAWRAAEGFELAL